MRPAGSEISAGKTSLLADISGQEQQKQRSGHLLQAEAVLRTREAASPHIGGIFRGSLGDQRREIGIALDKARFELREKAEYVVGDEDLAVAGRRCADTDCRDGRR